MVKGFRNFVVPCMLLASLLILIFATSACGSDSSPTSTTNSAATNSTAPTSSSAGNTSNTAVQTVNVKESRTAGQPDVYRCDQTSITIKKGDSIQFTNQTDEVQDFDLGDTQKAGVDLRLELNQSSAVAFNTPGTFILTSEKGATIKVTVQ